MMIFPPYLGRKVTVEGDCGRENLAWVTLIFWMENWQTLCLLNGLFLGSNGAYGYVQLQQWLARSVPLILSSYWGWIESVIIYCIICKVGYLNYLCAKSIPNIKKMDYFCLISHSSPSVLYHKTKYFSCQFFFLKSLQNQYFICSIPLKHFADFFFSSISCLTWKVISWEIVASGVGEFMIGKAIEDYML